MCTSPDPNTEMLYPLSVGLKPQDIPWDMFEKYQYPELRIQGHVWVWKLRRYFPHLDFPKMAATGQMTILVDFTVKLQNSECFNESLCSCSDKWFNDLTSHMH